MEKLKKKELSLQHILQPKIKDLEFEYKGEDLHNKIQQLIPLVQSVPPEKRKELLKMLQEMKEKFNRIKFDE